MGVQPIFHKRFDSHHRRYSLITEAKNPDRFEGGSRLDNFSSNSMLDVFIYETTQNIEQLEAAILTSEKAG